MPKDDRDADVVILNGPTEDGRGVRVLRARTGNLEVGEVRPLVEGKPLQGEVVTLRPRPDDPQVCDVKVELAPPAPKEAGAPTKAGPAQVATDIYRDNWEATFGKRKKAAALN
jgi:hypothetical protein